MNLSNEIAEISVIGGMLNNEALLYECLASMNEEYFSNDATKKAFNKIAELSEGGKVTSRTVLDRVSGKDKELIRTADSKFIDVECFKRDIAEVKDFYYKRQLNYTMNIATQQLATDKKADGISEYIGEQLSGLLMGERGLALIDPKVRASEALLEFYERVENPEKSYGIRFSVGKKGFPSIDQALLGAKKGDLILMGAKTGIGKTALGVTIARLFSFTQNYCGYYANTEMRKEELEARILSPIAGASVREIDSGMIEGSQREIDQKVEQIGNAYHEYSKAKFYSNRMPGMTVQKIKSMAKQVLIKSKRLDYIIVDYIQRMDDAPGHGGGEHDRLRKIAMRLKELAIELDVPIIMLGQRNEEGYIEGAKSIANECDAVFFFEPITEEDNLEKVFQNPNKLKLVNFKLTKRKVRRDDNPYPIYCSFDKKMQLINEVVID